MFTIWRTDIIGPYNSALLPECQAIIEYRETTPTGEKLARRFNSSVSTTRNGVAVQILCVFPERKLRQGKRRKKNEVIISPPLRDFNCLGKEPHYSLYFSDH